MRPTSLLKTARCRNAVRRRADVPCFGRSMDASALGSREQQEQGIFEQSSDGPNERLGQDWERPH